MFKEITIDGNLYNIITDAKDFCKNAGEYEEFQKHNIFIDKELDISIQVNALINRILNSATDNNDLNIPNQMKLQNCLLGVFTNNKSIDDIIYNSRKLKVGHFQFDIYFTHNQHKLNFENEFILLKREKLAEENRKFTIKCFFKSINTYHELNMDNATICILTDAFFEILKDDNVEDFLFSVEPEELQDNQIKIGYNIVEISEVENLFNVHEDKQTVIDAVGHYDGKKLIKIEKNMSQRQKLETTIHEVLHAAIDSVEKELSDMFVHKLDERKGLKDVAKDAEETIVSELANVLTSLIFDNPHQFEKLKEYKANERLEDDELRALLGKMDKKDLMYDALETKKRIEWNNKELGIFPK